jgi:thiol-disulfide isomerase/thioredoxin
MKRRSLLAALTALPLMAKPREDMPKFRAKSITGELFDKDALHGKKVLIQLWATWCGYCRREEAVVEALAKEFAAQGLIVLAVNVGESRKKVEAYLKTNERPHSKIILNEDSNLPAMIGPRGFPFYVVLDEAGKVAEVQAGSGGEPALRAMLEEVGLKAAE